LIASQVPVFHLRLHCGDPVIKHMLGYSVKALCYVEGATTRSVDSDSSTFARMRNAHPARTAKPRSCSVRRWSIAAAIFDQIIDDRHHSATKNLYTAGGEVRIFVWGRWLIFGDNAGDYAVAFLQFDSVSGAQPAP
jgi:hypothetical protein